MAEQETKTEGKRVYTVLNKKLGGGPHGLGDPDDQSLRKIENDVLVANLVRKRSREEKCIPEVKAFNECCVENKYMMVLNCRKENSKLIECLSIWFHDEKFWEETKQMYLKERSEFRSTGEPKKIREFKARAAAENL